MKEAAKVSYVYPENAPGYLPYLDSTVFFVKLSLACSLLTNVLFLDFCQLISFSSFWYLPVVLSLIHATVYYAYGWILHNPYERGWFPTFMQSRPRKVAKQSMDWNVFGVIQGECIGLLMNCCFLGFAVKFGGMTYNSNSCITPFCNLYDFCRIFLWYMFAFCSADLLYYLAHYWFHESPWAYRVIHKKHQIFQYQVAWSAEVKTVKESIIVSASNILPHFFFGGHFIYVVSWVIVGVLFNLEDHSGYAFLFIKRNDFHDFHHVTNTGNYGIAPYLDQLFGTCKKWEKWIKQSSE